jgi:hypothetical protein
VFLHINQGSNFFVLGPCVVASWFDRLGIHFCGVCAVGFGFALCPVSCCEEQRF